MTEHTIRDELHALLVEESEDLTNVLLASPVIRRIQAEAIREAAESLNREFQDIPAWREAYEEGVRTTEWMMGGSRMVVSAVGVLNARADETEAEGAEQ